MDPLESLHQESDSSLLLAKEAQNRGHKIFIYEPKDLTLKDNKLFANVTATYLIEHLNSKTFIINNPKSVRDAPEKLHVTYFKNLAPPTLISQSEIEIEKFIKKHKNIIVKPLYEKGGKGIFKITSNSENINKKIQNILKKEKLPIIIQKYIPQVKEGD